MQLLRWNNPGAAHPTSVFYDEGLDVANQTRAPGGGRKMFLTSPYIEQAISLKTPAGGDFERNEDVATVEPLSDLGHERDTLSRDPDSVLTYVFIEDRINRTYA